MAYPTDRVILHDRAGNLLPELCPDEVFSRIRSEEINGVHEMVIVTTRRMEEGWRALTVDATGTWREWVLTEPDEAHENGETALGTYRFVWSLQYDLTTSYSHTEAEAGMGSSCTSLVALQKALEGVNDWVPGICDAPSIPAGKGCVMIYESAWSRLSKVVEATGGEVEAQITVSNLYGVTEREVNLRAHVGSTSATRRFDWGHDVANIHRVPDPGPYYCRIVPLGRGEQEYAEDDETTFEWPLDITEETGDPNLYYVQDDEAAEVFKVPDGQGGWLYPTKAVSYSEDDPELLLNAAMEDLHNHTRPGVTYEANVFQFAEAGMDVKGVALGDDIHIVDRGFNPDAALRIQGRIVKIEVDELSPETTTVLTIGSVRDGITSITGALSNLVGDLYSKQRDLSEKVATLDTAAYLRGLLDRINAEISATGGYAYLVPGEGIITYDAEVSDPLIGTEATKVVQIKGGAIRIANSRKANFGGINDWEWKSVFTSGHILADLVTAAQLTSGYIGSPTSGNYWNLDTGELRMASVVDQINLSATNLVRNGDFSNQTSLWLTSGTTTSIQSDSSFDSFVQAVQGGAGGSSYRIYPSTVDNFKHEVGKTYSISFWAKANASNKIWCSVGGYQSEARCYVMGEDIGTSWKRYTGTITNAIEASVTFFLENAGTLSLTHVMLVEGNKPMLDWSPSPLDALVPVDKLLTQTEIFNRLTNNGAIEGLYMSGGNLYINASYIKSGIIDADLIKTGYIGNKDNTSYWNLSNGTIVIRNTTTNRWGDTESLKFGSVQFIENSGWLNTIQTTQTAAGVLIGTETDYANDGRLILVPNIPANSSSTAGSMSAILSRYPLKIMGNYSSGSGAYYRGGISFNSGYIEINMVHGTQGVIPGIIVDKNGYVYLGAKRSDYALNNGSSVTSATSVMSVHPGTSAGVSVNAAMSVYGSLGVQRNTTGSTAKVTFGEDTSTRYVDLQVYGHGKFNDGLTVIGDLSCTGKKPRLVYTKNYNDRLVFAYETPSPMFGDIGSGTIGDDGLCYVEIDDVFSETVRTDIDYQVFLQKCGEGDLWVSEKNRAYFVVEGTPGLPFDWELKAHQRDYENTRIEQKSLEEISHELIKDTYHEWAESVYTDDLAFIGTMESIYNDELDV